MAWMYFLKLILRNTLRHKLRTGLTVIGLVVAFLSFGLLQTIVDAWYHGADAAAPNRLITRNAVSLTVPLPLHYRERVRAVEGVRSVATANWFAGVYQDPKNFFMQTPVVPEDFLDMNPEVKLPPEQKKAWLETRTGAIVGRSLADKYHWKIGSRIPIETPLWCGSTRA